MKYYSNRFNSNNRLLWKCNVVSKSCKNKKFKINNQINNWKLKFNYYEQRLKII